MNILVIKTGALGDVLRTSFIAQALKDKYKNHSPKIYWITAKNAIPLFVNNPYVDRVVQKENKQVLRNINFDIAINLEEDEEYCKFVSSLSAKNKIGFLYENGKIIPSRSAREWFDMSAIGEKPRNDILKKKNKKTHRQLISDIVGIRDYERYEPFLRLNDKQRNLANNFLRRYNLSRKEIIVGINTGSGERWPKDLPISLTVKLIEKIYKKFKAKILLFGGPNEVERNKEILKLSKVPIIYTGSGNDLIEFPSLVSVCNLFITSDTLGLHVALALKRKTIALIGPTSFAEIDMLNLGDKIRAKSDCLCCYREDCRSMTKVNINEITNSLEKMLKQKITVIITAFKEPRTIGKAIESAINQKTHYDYEIIVSAPDEETLLIARRYAQKNKRVKLFKDPGKGKMHALNLLFDRVKGDILILTDGDVFLSKNSVEEISDMFLDPEIGCVTGKPTPVENRSTKYGYWANFLFNAAHKLRKSAFVKNDFIECSGYLFAFRKNKNVRIPLDTAEDAVIPYFFWEKGYRIGYAEKAEVYIKNVDNWNDWIKQKTRTSIAHETLDKYVNTKMTPRVKSFKTESAGITSLFTYPHNLKEMYWSMLLAFARLYMWLVVFYRKKTRVVRVDKWERVESAR